MKNSNTFYRVIIKWNSRDSSALSFDTKETALAFVRRTMPDDLESISVDRYTVTPILFRSPPKRKQA